jgi:hypothetical protein
MAGLILALLWRADATSLFLAFCCGAFLATTLKFASQQHRVLTQSLVAPHRGRRPSPTS